MNKNSRLASSVITAHNHNSRPSNGLTALRLILTKDGETLAKHTLDAPPVLDGMAIAAGNLYISNTAGELLCLDADKK